MQDTEGAGDRSDNVSDNVTNIIIKDNNCVSVTPEPPNGTIEPQVNGQNSEVHSSQEEEAQRDDEEGGTSSSPVFTPDGGQGLAMQAPVAMQGQPTTQATPMPPIQVDGQPTSIQSDPQQSAFRPALPGGQMYPGMENSPTPQLDFQYRNGINQPQMGGNMAGGPGSWPEIPQDMSGYGPPQPMGVMGMPNQPPHGMPSHHMPQPMSRRPITGNVNNFPQPHYGGMQRPGGPFPPSPGPHQNQFMQKQNYGGAGWGSPSWSGSGQQPPAPPPMSMTPPPLNWNQSGQRRPGHIGGGQQGAAMPHTRNKPFGNVPYTGGHGHFMQNKTRSKNYPFPSKPPNSGK
jgi:hypothetical protein